MGDHDLHGGCRAECEIVLVTVPTPVDEELKPDLSYVASAGRAVFEAIPKGAGTIVVLEHGLPRGGARDVVPHR